MRKILFISFLAFASLAVHAVDNKGKVLSHSFELRYVTADSAANGETDFKGAKQWLTTDQRINYLSRYADFATKEFDDKNLDQLVVTDDELNSAMSKLKPQPLPQVRTVIPLNDWHCYAYRKGQKEEAQKRLEWYKQHHTGITIYKCHSLPTTIP